MLPGEKSRRRSQKGPGDTFPVLVSSIPQGDAGGKGYPGWNGGSPHREKGYHRLFWRGEWFFARAWNQLAIGSFLGSGKPMKINTFQEEARVLSN
jgi:hypothetical protein